MLPSGRIRRPSVLYLPTTFRQGRKATASVCLSRAGPAAFHNVRFIPFQLDRRRFRHVHVESRTARHRFPAVTGRGEYSVEDSQEYQYEDRYDDVFPVAQDFLPAKPFSVCPFGGDGTGFPPAVCLPGLPRRARVLLPCYSSCFPFCWGCLMVR